ncbi:MAG TPA: chemotaxis protein CheB [Pyrinomonadaceae bacterium]|nr:chemotaxis protein CheB [Pyrinomonadaceae bacterium]
MSENIHQDQSGAQMFEPHAGQDFLVVGIGASAGGIQALREFFARVPAESGMAYVVILHLSPDHDSQLASVLQSTTTMPVTQVERRVRVVPDHVYVIPPNKSLEIEHGYLDVSNVTSIEVRRAPVDIFFRALAESHHERAVGVVLSGTGANGSMGLKRIKERGGCAIVQDPQEAEYADMPSYSLATGLVDYVLPVAEMPAQIVAYGEQLRQLRLSEEPEEEQREANEAALRDILTQLRVRTGHDFSNYKRATVMRRMARRMIVHELASLPAYAQFMHERPPEAQALLKDLLISVTNFFRDPAAFAALEREVVPRLFEGKTADDQVRVWVAGCATGEEAYSVMMLLADYSINLSSPPQIQVFATDIDEAAIAVARDGIYTLNDAADISPERLSRYFIRETDDEYRVRREIRERVLFATHNVIKDPPFAHLDLATCRNLLIYLDRKAQRRVMDVLHFALNPGGYLMLGASESTDGASDLYAPVDKEHRIYQGRAVETRLVFPVPDASLITRLGKLPGVRRFSETQAPPRSSYLLLHQRLLERYAPPSVVVNEDYDIVHMSESVGRYMELHGGVLSPNLLSLVRPELRLELRAALYQATQKKTDVGVRPVALRVGDETRLISMQVKPVLSEEDKARGFILVVFEEPHDDAAAAAERQPQARSAAGDAEPIARQLEEELLEVKAQLSATFEQHELQREELKASNEELQAMNEEMRSAAEELETSKEELQSINEELTTVNQELKIKIEELGHSNNDFRNLMNSTQIGTVFLDRNLNVKLFTPRARDIFNLIPADVGRPLSDITSKLEDSSVLAEAATVLDTLQSIEREVRTTDDRGFLMQVVPYRTTEDRINGLVILFYDITERHRAERALRVHEERMRGLKEAFQAAANGAALEDSLSRVARIVADETTGEARTAFYIADPEGARLYPVWGAGSMSESYLRQADGFLIGEDALACGLAIPTGSPVLTPDVFKEPRWKNWLHMAEEHDFRGCWSFPIKTSENKAVGTFAMYFREPREATPQDLTLADVVTQAAAIIISKHVESRERARAEERLRESEERLQFAANVADFGIHDLDLTTGRIYWSPELKAMHGLAPEAEISLETLPELLHPEDRERLEKEMRAALDPKRTGEFEQEFRIVRPDNGETRWLYKRSRTTFAGHDHERRPVRSTGVVVDITERRRIQEVLTLSTSRLRLLVESASDFAIFTLTLDNRIDSWSVGAEQVFGWTEAEAIEQSGEIIFTPEDREKGEPEKELATARREGRAPDERWHVRKDGSRLFVSGEMQLLRDAEGRAQGFVKIARDISRQKQAEEDLRRAYIEMETRVRERTYELAQVNESLRDEISQRIQIEKSRVRLLRQIVRTQEDERRRIARDIHDQFGQQMTALRLNLGALEQGCSGDAELRRKLDQTKAIAERLDADVDFLAWELRPAALDDIGLSEALGNYVREWSKYAGVEAQFHTTGMEQGRLAPETETNLYRITQEALNNTMKYARATRADVLLERRDNQVVLIIEDDGIGFNLKKIEGDRQKGMGLIGMRERAMLAGGTLEIESKPKEGTTIFARVPVKFLEEEGEAE